VVSRASGKHELGPVKTGTPPDAITQAACRWLLAGGGPGTYTGPEPGPDHDLVPLLSRELGRQEISLSSAGVWFRQEQVIRTVLERISEDSIEVWAVKGFDLARSVYPCPGGRPMGDADLFMEEKNRQKILMSFHRAGWAAASPGAGIFSSGIVSEMKLHRQGVLVELHTHVFYFPATFPGKLPPDLFENGRYLEPGLMGFAWHNSLLLVLIHLLTNRVTRPVWWVDVCLLCRKVTETGSWSLFTRNALMTNLGTDVAGALATAGGMLGAPVPAAVMAALESYDGRREGVLERLTSRRKMPTLLNLMHLTGWKRVSWFYAMVWPALVGRTTLRLKRTPLRSRRQGTRG
jgi:hypothetical protein